MSHAVSPWPSGYRECQRTHISYHDEIASCALPLSAAALPPCLPLVLVIGHLAALLLDASLSTDRPTFPGFPHVDGQFCTKLLLSSNCHRSTPKSPPPKKPLLNPILPPHPNPLKQPLKHPRLLPAAHPIPPVHHITRHRRNPHLLPRPYHLRIDPRV